VPNGNPNFAEEELPALEAFFRPLAPTLERFASEHHLLIDRYYHDGPGWDFRFRHPRGGEAYVEVRRAADGAIKIIKMWWQDDYERATRSAKTEVSDLIPLGSIDLYSTLVSALRDALAWTPDCWDHVHSGYESVWHRTWTKQQFDALLDRLPFPALPPET